jgi:hypothetical protein
MSETASSSRTTALDIASKSSRLLTRDEWLASTQRAPDTWCTAWRQP